MFLLSFVAGVAVSIFFVSGLLFLIRAMTDITITKFFYFVICSIVNIVYLILFLCTDDDVSFLGLFLGLIAADAIIYFIVDKWWKCQHCGAWNSVEIVKYLSSKSWESWDDVKVKNKIYNKSNEEIGYIEDTRKELRAHACHHVLCKCTKCGIEFTKYDGY